MREKKKIGGRIFDVLNVILMVFLIILKVYTVWNQLMLSFADRQYLYLDWLSEHDSAHRTWNLSVPDVHGDVRVSADEEGSSGQ